METKTQGSLERVRAASWPLVSIIIVNWNGLPWLKTCLPSLAKVTYPNLEVIVVDNGSTDGSLAYLERSRTVTTVVRNQTNLGFAYPNNQGIECATGEFILFLNNDMRYEPSFIEPLIEACQRPGIGAAQPKIVLLDDERRLDLVGSYLTPSGVLAHVGYGQPADRPAFNRERDIFSAKGAALMVRRDVLEQTKLPPGRSGSLAGKPRRFCPPAGGPVTSEVQEASEPAPNYFDADYFAYFEETDLCWRIWLVGWRIRYIPTALVWHAGGQTAKRISTFAHYHSFKNRLATLIKNLGPGALLWMGPFHLVLMVLASGAYALTGQLHAAGATWRAIGWNLVQLPATLRKRSHVQRIIRRILDHGLLPQISRRIPMSYFYYLFTARLEQWPAALTIEGEPTS